MTDPTTIRRGIERAQTALGSAAFHASVWEGREGWAGHPVDARRRHGGQALEELGTVIDTLGDLQIALRAAMRAETGGTCGTCHRAFDPADTRFDGHAEDRSTPGYCRSCVDRCHEGDSDHRCPICA
jgi:hypothetical protein